MVSTNIYYFVSFSISFSNYINSLSQFSFLIILNIIILLPLESNRIYFIDVSDRLVLFINGLPLLLETQPQLLYLFRCHQESIFSFIIIFNIIYFYLSCSSASLKCRFQIIWYSFQILSFIRVRYSGVLPKSFLLVQLFSSGIVLGAAKIFSTALVTMKFLLDLRPMIGFSSFLGTGGLVIVSLYLNALTDYYILI